MYVTYRSFFMFQYVPSLTCRILQELSEKHHLEKSKLLSQIQTLEKEISCLSSSSFAREKETLRKDLEKTKSKLRETEFKLKNTIQEKTKLEVLFHLL